MWRKLAESTETPRYTPLQGQYLALIYAYSTIHRRPPAEADFQAFFRVTAPSVHRMVLQLERLRLIRRTPRAAAPSSYPFPPPLSRSSSLANLRATAKPERTSGRLY